MYNVDCLEIGNQQIRSFGRIIMKSIKVNFFLAIMWIVLSPAWIWADNDTMGILWLCAGVAALIIALVRYNKEKKSK